MEYRYLTADLRNAAVIERRKQIEADHFRATVDKTFALEKDPRADTSALDAKLASLEADGVAIDKVAPVVAVAIP